MLTIEVVQHKQLHSSVISNNCGFYFFFWGGGGRWFSLGFIAQCISAHTYQQYIEKITCGKLFLIEQHVLAYYAYYKRQIFTFIITLALGYDYHSILEAKARRVCSCSSIHCSI